MCFMMQGHVLDALVTRDVIVTTELPWSIWHLIRGFTAPIFLMVSGAVHAFATKRDEDGRVREDVIAKRIRWAFTIIGIGYFMMFPAGRVWDFPFVSDAGWQWFLGGEHSPAHRRNDAVVRGHHGRNTIRGTNGTPCSLGDGGDPCCQPPPAGRR